jgi:ribonuclease E
MTKKTIIIDAAHKEETRVSVLQEGRLQDFDREALAVKRIKGNIYLAKITRVEASLQSAFIDYGSDRHGFLPFSDIHPDYYQLPEAEKNKIKEITHKDDGDNSDSKDSEDDLPRKDSEDSDSITTGAYSVEDETGSYSGNINNLHKKYNIQDVIKPGQIVLVQVLKEERGNKGAAMTTFISIAGKYCVLMANTPNKGGVSKKVDNFRDRKILRTILNDLNVPSEKSVIIRTAGVGKKPEELKRDYDYLVRLWNSIRETTLTSTAPTFIHAEDDVIKKCMRDVYDDSVKEVIVEGKEAYDSIVDFVQLIMPSGVNNVKYYEDRIPVFNKYKVEQQILGLYEKEVTLPSGGSIVIDHTEALVAIDVNSGKSTNERDVEKTAYSTNLEAAVEIARQLRLRDLAGLIVIDFIDMYDQKNKRTVERTLRDSLKNDRARIQIGRVSIFGLMEMSRQRLGASFFETITDPCKHCSGTGYVRSVEIVAVSILRAIRHSCTEKNVGVIHVATSGEVITYMLNFKRKEIAQTEKSYNIHILMCYSEDVGPNGFSIKKKKSLSSEEKRELELEVATGKVNQLGIEREVIEDAASQETSHKKSGPRRRPVNNNRSRNHKPSPRHNEKNSPAKKPGLFGLFKKK